MTTPPPSIPFSPAEVAVIRRHFSPVERKGRRAVLQEHSTIMRETTDRAWPDSLRRDVAGHSGPIQEAVEDFIAKNQTPSSFAPLPPLLPSLDLTVLPDAVAQEIFADGQSGWDVFRERFGPVGCHSLSRIGLSSGGATAVFFCYSQYDWLAGRGGFGVFVKFDTGWEPVSRVRLGWTLIS